jgi:hypothetical protein
MVLSDYILRENKVNFFPNLVQWCDRFSKKMEQLECFVCPVRDSVNEFRSTPQWASFVSEFI